jgi:hypothetical protein
MRRKLQLLAGTYVLAAAMLLAFGPAPAAAEAAVRACVKSVCQADCQNLGFDRGRCTTSGDCVCSYCTHPSGDIC